MQADPAAGATDRELLVVRLAETETLLAAERASNQALSDDILRIRAEKNASAAATGIVGGDNNGSASAAATAGEEAEPPPADTARRRNRGGDERPRPPWQNVLYKRQPYADNHVPDSFLEKLVTNGECANYKPKLACVIVPSVRVGLRLCTQRGKLGSLEGTQSFGAEQFASRARLARAWCLCGTTALITHTENIRLLHRCLCVPIYIGHVDGRTA